MSEADGAFSALVESASQVTGAGSLAMVEADETSQKSAAENRTIYRGTLAHYLGEMIKVLHIAGVPDPAVQPLESLREQLAAIDQYGTLSPAFAASHMPFGLTKPMGRLRAEGAAVGCVAYLNKVTGLGVMDACGAVASLFSHVGHTGRNGGPLGPKTLHMWYSEIAAKPDLANLGETLRWGNKLSAMNELHIAEATDPTAHLPQEQARAVLAERMGYLAAMLRLGDMKEPRVSIEDQSD